MSGQKGRKPRKSWHRRTSERRYLSMEWPDTHVRKVVPAAPVPLRQGQAGFKKKPLRS